MKAGIPVDLYTGLIEADTVTTEIHGGAGHFGNVMGDFLVKELNGRATSGPSLIWLDIRKTPTAAMVRSTARPTEDYTSPSTSRLDMSTRRSWRRRRIPQSGASAWSESSGPLMARAGRCCHRRALIAAPDDPARRACEEWKAGDIGRPSSK